MPQSPMSSIMAQLAKIDAKQKHIERHLRTVQGMHERRVVHETVSQALDVGDQQERAAITSAAVGQIRSALGGGALSRYSTHASRFASRRPGGVGGGGGYMSFRASQQPPAQAPLEAVEEQAAPAVEGEAAGKLEAQIEKELEKATGEKAADLPLKSAAEMEQNAADAKAIEREEQEANQQMEEAQAEMKEAQRQVEEAQREVAAAEAANAALKRDNLKAQQQMKSTISTLGTVESGLGQVAGAV